MNRGHSCQGALISWAKSQEAPWTMDVDLASFDSLPQEASDPWRSFDIAPHLLGFPQAPQTTLSHVGGGGVTGVPAPQPYQLHVLDVHMENDPFPASLAPVCCL